MLQRLTNYNFNYVQLRFQDEKSHFISACFLLMRIVKELSINFKLHDNYFDNEIRMRINILNDMLFVEIFVIFSYFVHFIGIWGISLRKEI